MENITVEIWINDSYNGFFSLKKWIFKIPS
jgi:hypothetical protein